MSKAWEPLRVSAHLQSGVAPPTPFLLDGPLFAACVRQEADRRGVEPEELPRLRPERELPLLIHWDEAVHSRWLSACSDAVYEVAARDVAYWSKRTDVDDYTEVGSRDRSVSLKSNRYRNHRQPLYLEVTGRIDWYLMGDGKHIEALLPYIGGLGKKRDYGFGKVRRWEVSAADGDYSLRREDGSLARPIPLAHTKFAGRIEATKVQQMACNPPYWTNHRTEPCAVEGRWR